MAGGGLLGLLNVSKGFAAESARSQPQNHQIPKIALIIDDIGYNRSLAWQFVELNEILTFSILPQVSYSRELAFELNVQGYEVMLHQPMEPYNNGGATARRYHMPTAHRNVFLDNVREEAAVMSQLAHLQRHAMHYGRAIGIGHPFPVTARAIGRFAKRLKKSNVSLVPVSEIL